MLFSAFLFSLMQIFVRVAGANVPVVEQIFFRNVLGIAVYFAALKKGAPPFGRRRNQKLLFGWSIAAAVGIFFGFTAVSTGEQSGVSSLLRTAPFFVILPARRFLGERVRAIQILSLVIAFAGSFFLFAPGSGYYLPSLLTAVISAACSAVAFIFVGLLNGKESAATQGIHYSALSILTSVPFMLSNFVWPSPAEWSALLAIGVCGALGVLFQNIAYSLAPVSEMSIYTYSGIIFSTLLGALVLKEKLRFLPACGAFLIIAAALLVYLFPDRRVSSKDRKTETTAESSSPSA